ncbi:MAG: helix-turn-helix domain-containing protein, partial [Candidatus Aenigmatarchaeota archaeon]
MDNLTDEFAIAKKELAKDIVGEIVLSENSDKVIRKWRTIFKISQKRLAKELGITSSVISDYESGRRKSPGIKMIKRYVEALLNIDAARGGNIIRSFVKSNKEQPLSSAIMDIKEFSGGLSIQDFCKKIDAEVITKSATLDKEIYGYTIIDSLKAITELSYSELVKLYGMTTQRALIFTKVTTGKTPMVAIKLTNLHPALVVLHSPETVDDVAKRIA